MKLKFYSILLLALGLGFATTSCSDDDKNDSPDLTHSQVPEVVAKAFEAKYPEVNPDIVKWEVEGNYHVAEYNVKNTFTDVDAWFNTATGAWSMTESHYGENLFLIPTALNVGFINSGYSQWENDDIVFYEYPDSSRDVYIFYMEKTGEPDTALYFDKDGKLLKTGPSDNLDITPETQLI